jgi:ribosomal protein L7/L12
MIQSGSSGPEHPVPGAAGDERLAAEIRTLMNQGQKIQAIKVYRERTSAGLADAKRAVEAIGRGESLSRPDSSIEAELAPLLDRGEKIQAINVYRQRTGADLAEAKRAVEAIQGGESARSIDSSIETELAPLLEQGKKIQAIKVYRDRTGAGLKEAKDAVEAMQPRYPYRAPCPRCGARVEQGDAACHSCGAELPRPGSLGAWWVLGAVAAVAALVGGLVAAGLLR